ncbi:TIGR02757 family protein [Flavobacterium sp.]|uniref:TIGR02757 family protein n=1 Tax=Flavobacterium sp. TaxID=239 RepID=UPI00260FD8D1|nr:TIGR02757 family protein [Flavobacterium sp.]
MEHELMKEYLDELVLRYNRRDFIDADPIRIPHEFDSRTDIEIAGFLIATISWGNRAAILKSGAKMMDLMGNSPYDFVMNSSSKQQQKLDDFVHRTFNGLDFRQFILSLRRLFQTNDSLENFFITDDERLQTCISRFRAAFFEDATALRSFKHVSDPLKNSAAKRINMYLRWMVRKDAAAVDFGIWDRVKMQQLSCPLDVHSGGIARELGLLKRKQNDAQALLELDTQLRLFDAHDPVKYDYALFGLGVNKKALAGI